MAVDEATPELKRETGPDLGLALSGGGVRAALFSLGVVIGLIESGCHRRVRCIASVSGGSILNAALAHAPSLGSFPSVEKFETESSKLAARLATRGVFAFDRRTIASGLWTLLKASPPLVFALAIALAMIADRLPDEWKRALAGLDLSSLPLQALGWIALASVLLSVWLSRGLLQELQYASVLGGGLRLLVKDWGAKEEKEPRMMHVLVATDLLSGEPIYFSSEFVYCKPYGWSTPKKIKTAEALYSSAAFPAVFPPKRLRMSRLSFRSGDMPGALPRTLRLADGGVYNNLGYDWFDVLNDQSPPLLWAFGGLKIKPLRIEQENQIIVNASAPTGRVPGGWVHWLGPFTLARIMSVLYDNTVKPRVILLRGRPLLDIQESPLDLAKRLAELYKDKEDVACRTKHLVTTLTGSSDAFWADFSRDTAGTKTKLSPAGPRPAARLMLHGYLSSLVLLHARFEGKLPDKIRGEGYFLDLVEGNSSSDGGVPPHDETNRKLAPITKEHDVSQIGLSKIALNDAAPTR